MEPLYIKTFSGFPGVVYKKETTRPARSSIFVGIFLLLMTCFYIEYFQMWGFLIVLISFVSGIVGFVVFYFRMRKLHSEITQTITPQTAMFETHYSFDGGTRWIPFSPYIGVLLGFIIYQFVTHFLGRETSSIINTSLISFGSGCLLAIGITYRHLEYKFGRSVLVQNYNRLKTKNKK